MAFSNLKHSLQRRRFESRAAQSPLANLYKSNFPTSSQSFLKTNFLVVDCEMNGLNPKINHLLSIGWVEIKNGRIIGASAKQILIRSEQGVGDSILIHGLHDHMLTSADSIKQALTLFAHHLKDKIIVFHHAPIDLKFLQTAAYNNFGCPFLFPYVDTMEIEKKRLQHQDKIGALRLQSCRERYGLPNFPQHGALNDAQATAELFLAQSHYLHPLERLRAGDLKIHCA